jgi:lipopolysaccharide export system ATP-binding protein
MNILQICDVTKQYGNHIVVDGVNLEIKEREIVGLLGPNGAGKTSTFHIITGIIKADKGSVFLNNENITNLPMHKRAKKGIVFLPQEPSIFRKLTVEENIIAILELINFPKSQREQKLNELLSELSIEKLRKKKCYYLSGGERRKVEITRALALDPLFLLLDEPFTGIDPITVSELQNILYRLKEKGIGVLITDHNVRETLKITDRAYLIYHGRILVSGNSEMLIKDERAREVYLGKEFNL